MQNTQDKAEKQSLAALLEPAAFATTVMEQRTSVLDLLEKFPSVKFPFAAFLATVPPLRTRHYSISSSPLADPARCSLTYSVIDQPGWADSTRNFHGVAGTYLQGLRPGDQALVSVRSTNKFFRLPVDPEKTPLLMFCVGSGLAPFRGFIQERAVLVREGGRTLAPAILFVGCRSATHDRLYADELDAWAREGIVDVRYAFSREPEHPLAGGCARVAERMVRDRVDVFRLYDEGAKVYTCGSGEFAKGLGAAARQIILERAKEEGHGLATGEEVEQWFADKKNERFVTDVFD